MWKSAYEAEHASDRRTLPATPLDEAPRPLCLDTPLPVPTQQAVSADPLPQRRPRASSVGNVLEAQPMRRRRTTSMAE